MLAEVNIEPSILDYLNEDCLCAVLQYVPVKDVMRTERASHGWQAVVLAHLQALRIIIEDYDDEEGIKNNKHKFCSIIVDKRTFDKHLISFESWTITLGPSVVATCCYSFECLAVIKENCPNLEALKLANMDPCTAEDLLPYNLNENFKFVQKMSFTRCSIKDSGVSQFVADKALEKLELQFCTEVIGLCFLSMNLSNLKSLEIDDCGRGQLDPQYFLQTIGRLSELRELKLFYISWILAAEIQSELDKMPKLECLEVYCDRSMRCHSSEPLSRLTQLKHLSVSYQLNNSDVEAVVRGCRELRTLELLDCQVADGGRRVSPDARAAGARGARCGRAARCNWTSPTLTSPTRLIWKAIFSKILYYLTMSNNK